MSALRRLLAAVWAAIWVRWRLLAARANGASGGRRPAADGSGYYLSAAEIPVEGVDYEPVDLPPELAARLDASRGELVEHARATTARRTRRRRIRRRRTASLAMATLLTLATLGAGASALVTGSTGIPAVDRVLGIFEKNLERREPADQPESRARSQQPDPAVRSTSITVPGRPPMVTAWYVARNGTVCSLLTDADQGRTGDLACVPPSQIVARLEQQGGALYNATDSPAGTFVRGYVRSDVERLRGSGPGGRLDLYLGDVWSTGVQDVPSIRPFVGVDRGPVHPPISTRNYRIRAVTEDDARLEVWP